MIFAKSILFKIDLIQNSDAIKKLVEAKLHESERKYRQIYFENIDKIFEQI